jgi:subtilase family serine protease
LTSSALGYVAIATGGAGALNGHANVAAVCPVSESSGAHCDALVVTNAQGNPLASTTPPVGAYGPTQFHVGYNLPLTATSTQVQKIGIVDAYDDPNIAGDLATFDSYYNLPPCTIANGCLVKVNQTGGTSYPRSNSGWALEISLDVEMAHEICQNCHIMLVEASSASMANLGAAVNEAVALGANVISNSYGSNEYSSEVADQNSYFNHPGVAITASAGDGGYGVEFPAASSYVTAVGGTTLNLNANATYHSESVWSGTGSGCSGYATKPSWQKDTGCSNRTVADVSADADPSTGAAVYDSVRYQGQSGWYQVGGTSLSSPLIAAVYALAGNASSASATYGSYLYAHSSSLHDVTSGSNGSCGGSYLCTAGVGYDGPTGLGSPNGTGGF